MILDAVSITAISTKKQSRKVVAFFIVVIETAYNQSVCKAKRFGIKSRNNRTARHTKWALRSAITAISTKY